MKPITTPFPLAALLLLFPLGDSQSCAQESATQRFVVRVPPRVVLQESIRLAERYGSAQSARFVNGVLDALARRMGRL